MKNIVVREAAFDEAQLIADLTRAAWANKVAPTSSGHHESAERVTQDLLVGGGFILLVNHIPIGSVRWLPLDDAPDILEITRMGVLPAYRGENLSQHLIEAVTHHALAHEISELRLAVRSDQLCLLDFYMAFGFEAAPELEYSHANPLEPMPAMMRKNLRS